MIDEVGGEPKMKTFSVQAEVTAERFLEIEVPCDVPPGQVDVVLMVQPLRASAPPLSIDRGELFGIGREVRG
jgi:hypothetical protein